jgi:hypothetical protein
MRPSSGLYRAWKYKEVGTQWDPIGFTVELQNVVKIINNIISYNNFINFNNIL